MRSFIETMSFSFTMSFKRIGEGKGGVETTGEFTARSAKIWIIFVVIIYYRKFSEIVHLFRKRGIYLYK